MTEARRLLEESRDPRVLGLLGAWREQTAPLRARQRTAVALGLAAALGSAAASGATGASSGLWLARIAVLKWLAGGVLCGVGLVSGVEVAHRSSARPAQVEQSVPPPAPIPPAPAPKPEVASAGEGATPPSSARSAGPVRPPAGSKPAPASIAGEIAALDRARQELTQGNPKGALNALDELEAGGHTGTFAPELLWLRIEALDQIGKHDRALELARRYLAEHPSGPMAGRLRARWR